MQYQWFRDIPRYVTRREYQQYQFRRLCALGLGAMSAMMAIAAITGITMKPARDLAVIDAITIAEAVAHGGDRLDVVKLEGFLVADNSPTMPDDEARRVIHGALSITARGDADSGGNESAGPLREVLFDWEESVDAVFLSDGDRRLPLAFDLTVLPMPEEEHPDLSPNVMREGDSARARRPVAIEYGDRLFSLSPDMWGDEESVFVDVDRRVLPQGASVVVVAALESTPQGSRLVDPLGDRLKVSLGKEDDIRRQGEQARLLFAILCVPMGIASVLVGRSTHRLWQEFLDRQEMTEFET
jgi:hypothetical protein